MQDTEKNTHGGAGRGQGRKKGRKRATVALSLPIDLIEWIDSLVGEGYRSQAVSVMLTQIKTEGNVPPTLVALSPENPT